MYTSREAFARGKAGRKLTAVLAGSRLERQNVPGPIFYRRPIKKTAAGSPYLQPVSRSFVRFICLYKHRTERRLHKFLQKKDTAGVPLRIAAGTKKAFGKPKASKKSGNPDSNRGPLRPERSALPAALLPEKM